MDAKEILTPDPSWDILDSTKLSCYMACPRQYFFRYLLGWRSSGRNNHLDFGTAWHIGQEHLLLNNFTPLATLEAVILAVESYREHFPAETDELFEPKTMLNLSMAMESYATKYRPLHAEHKVLYTELAGLVLVSDQRTMVFKCDAILRDEHGAVFGLDHKTSQYRNPNWGDHWTLSTQMLTYLHALQCMYPDQDSMRMLVRCAFFYKNGHAVLEEHPIEKSLEQMEAWLNRTNQWIDRLMADMDALLSRDNTDRPVRSSFPQNDKACFSFGRRCEFFDFCNAWPNPLDRCEEPPLGFNVEWWDPLARPEIRATIVLGGAHEARKGEQL